MLEFSSPKTKGAKGTFDVTVSLTGNKQVMMVDESGATLTAFIGDQTRTSLKKDYKIGDTVVVQAGMVMLLCCREGCGRCALPNTSELVSLRVLISRVLNGSSQHPLRIYNTCRSGQDSGIPLRTPGLMQPGEGIGPTRSDKCLFSDGVKVGFCRVCWGPTLDRDA